MSNGLRSQARPEFAAACVAVLGGCLLLVVIGAPLRMPLTNFAALLIGLSIIALVKLAGSSGLPAKAVDRVLLVVAFSMPATAVFGQPLEGVSRWIVIAGLTVQPSYIAVPIVAVALASRPSAIRAAAAAVAAAGAALQPDAGGAALLLGGLAGAMIARPRARALLGAFAIAAAALAVALWRAPGLPPVPFVEGILATAFSRGPVSTALMVVGLVAALLPAVLAKGRDRHAALSFAGVWAAGMAASVSGNYPTPLFGFGGSAILGYLLSLHAMAGGAVASARSGATVAPAPGEYRDGNMRFI